MKLKLICEKCSTTDKKVNLDLINQNLTCPKCGKVYQENFQELNGIIVASDDNLKFVYNADDDISFGKEKIINGKEKNPNIVSNIVKQKLSKQLFKNGKKDVTRYELTVSYTLKAFYD